ncbi:MAG TPA: arginine repressor [Acidobacteriota bacterium]|nr:arginine repressor [Acidobacteriota bacterium]
MISKRLRQAKLLEIIGKHRVSSQEKLSSLFMREGVTATQATLSRDIREMGIVKVRGAYSRPIEWKPPLSDELVRRAFHQYIMRTGVSGNIVMIKTTPGNAHSIGVLLDDAQWNEILGTVAGDDTVFILLKNNRYAGKVQSRIRELSL